MKLTAWRDKFPKYSVHVREEKTKRPKSYIARLNNNTTKIYTLPEDGSNQVTTFWRNWFLRRIFLNIFL